MDFTAITWANRPSTTSPINATNLNRIDSGIAALYKLTASVTHNIASDADYTLTAAQDAYGRVVITDTGVVLTTARNIVLATASERGIYFQNDTAQTLTLKTSAGTGIAVLAGEKKCLYCDGTNVVAVSTALTSTDIGVTVQAYDADTTKNDVVNTFTAAQRVSEVQIAWSATPSIDFSAGNDFYIDTTGATGEMAIGVSNVPAAGTNQSGIITIEYNATYTSPTWNAVFENTPTNLASSAGNLMFAYHIQNAKVYLGNKIERP